MAQVSEWICPDHPGFAGRKAKDWWALRFGRAEAEQLTVDFALGDMLLGARIRDVTALLTVVKRGKYFDIVRHGLRAIK
jgi:hypothetical protein